MEKNLNNSMYDTGNDKSEQEFADGCYRLFILAIVCILLIILILIYVNRKEPENSYIANQEQSLSGSSNICQENRLNNCELGNKSLSGLTKSCQEL